MKPMSDITDRIAAVIRKHTGEFRPGDVQAAAAAVVEELGLRNVERERRIAERALEWCKAHDGGRLCLWWPAGRTEKNPGYPIMAVNCDHGGTIEYGTFYDAKDADKMELICDVFNWALEQLAPSTQSFYGERSYAADELADDAP